MKRVLNLSLCFCLVLCLLPIFSLSVFANRDTSLSGNPLIVDNAGLLSKNERQALERKAQSISNAHGCEVVILTVNGTNGKSPQDYADDFFVYKDYGYGADRSGILFFMDMEERDWHVTTCGTAIQIFTDDTIDFLVSRFLGDISNGNYFDGFESYLIYTGQILSVADSSLSQEKLNDLNAEYNAFISGEETDTPDLDSGILFYLAPLLSYNKAVLILLLLYSLFFQ